MHRLLTNHTKCTHCLQITLHAHAVYKSHYMHTLFTNHTTCTLFTNHIIQYWSRTIITDNMWIIFRKGHASSVKLTTGKNNWTS